MQFLAFPDASITKVAALLIPHTPLTQSVFTFFSFAGGSFIIWLIPFILLILFEERKDHRFLFYFAATSLITAFLVDVVLKNVFIRLRPYIAWSIAGSVCPRDYSFPSGHAAFSFAAAAMLAGFDRKRAVWYYATAFLVSYSRIFLYCHYFSDVVAGAIIGYSISRFILAFHYHYKHNSGSSTRKNRKIVKKG
jgi:undecaprenyl-diphosphatase